MYMLRLGAVPRRGGDREPEIAENPVPTHRENSPMSILPEREDIQRFPA